VGARNTTKPRKTPAQSRSQAAVDALLTATAYVLAERGFAETTTNRIAEVAGVNIGTLYRYFPSKDALLGALIDRETEALVQSIERAVVEGEGKPLEVGVSRFFEAALEGHRLDPRTHRELLEQVGRTGRLETAAHVERRIAERWQTLLRSHSSSFPENEFLAWPVVEALVHAVLFRRPKEVNATTAKDAAVRFLLNGLLGPPRGPLVQPSPHSP
jgi:AcrR family transcriptional regulator